MILKKVILFLFLWLWGVIFVGVRKHSEEFVTLKLMGISFLIYDFSPYKEFL
jgi:hypothetical protein